MNTFESFVKESAKSDLKRMLIPMGYIMGWPWISIKNSEICVTIPYYRCEKAAGGGFELYPLAYSMTLIWRTKKVVDFTRYSFTKDFKGVDYARPIGYFKHEAIKDMTNDAYKEAMSTLFEYYGEIVTAIENKNAFTHESEMKKLFSKMMEPNMYPIYKKLAPAFFKAYCGN